MAKPQQKYEFDVRGSDERSDGNDPKHFVLLGDDYAGRPAIICDTLNCDSNFDLDEQRAHMERIALALNENDALRDALAAAYKFISQPLRSQRLSSGSMTSTYDTRGYNELAEKIRLALGI